MAPQRFGYIYTTPSPLFIIKPSEFKEIEIRCKNSRIIIFPPFSCNLDSFLPYPQVDLSKVPKIKHKETTTIQVKDYIVKPGFDSNGIFNQMETEPNLSPNNKDIKVANSFRIDVITKDIQINASQTSERLLKKLLEYLGVATQQWWLYGSLYVVTEASMSTDFKRI